MSNPRPGTKISKPVFGYELFVAQFQSYHHARKMREKVIHRLRTDAMIPTIL